MSGPIIPRDEAARELSVEPRVLLKYERRGLVRVVSEGEVEGYGPEDVRRLWTIVTYQRDLGVNLAGVEVVLKLRDHMADVRRRVGSLADRLRDALDDAEADRDHA